jgi:quercetin dioxygenase-like cupin family protein
MSSDEIIHRFPDLDQLAEENQPYGVEIKMFDGVFVKQMVLTRAATVVPQHSHEHDHMSMLALGSVTLWRDGAFVGEYSAPAGIFIPAKSKHTFVALSDMVIIYCIHNIERSGEVDIHAEHQLDLGDL